MTDGKLPKPIVPVDCPKAHGRDCPAPCQRPCWWATHDIDKRRT